MPNAAFYRKIDGAFVALIHGTEADIARNAPAPAQDYVRLDDVERPEAQVAMLADGAWALAPRAESLAEAKRRRVRELQLAGVERVRARFPAINNFDELRLVQQIIASIAPAARQPTADVAWLGQHWTAGSAAVAAIKAATTVAAVEAVTVTWPAA